jgi:hypothetical protein
MRSLACGSLPWGKPCFPHEPPSFTVLALRGAFGGAEAEVVTGEQR